TASKLLKACADPRPPCPPAGLDMLLCPVRAMPSELADTSPGDSRPARLAMRFDPFDIATSALLAALVVLALWTFRDYAISNDEGVQHHYGELILNYYASGFRDRSVFTFENL